MGKKFKCTECNGEGIIHITNADRIRAMSDEELAEWNVKCGACPAEFLFGTCPNIENKTDDDVCHKCWLDWLKKEAEK